MIGTEQAVRIGEFVVVAGPARLTIHGLGSCVAVFLHDPVAGLAALAHVLLPAARANGDGVRPGKFAESAVRRMLEDLVERGADPSRLEAKIVGGAEMFSFSGEGELLPIGARNVEAVRAVLRALGISIAAEDVGGKAGRTLTADAATGAVTVRTIRKGQRTL